jgi:hypothetical protein
MNAHVRTSRKLVPVLDRLEDRQVLSHMNHFAAHHAARLAARAAMHSAAIHAAVPTTAFVLPAAFPTAGAGAPSFDHGTLTLNDGEVVVAHSGVPGGSSTPSSNPAPAASVGATPSGTFMYGTTTLSNGEVVGAYSSSFIR